MATVNRLKNKKKVEQSSQNRQQQSANVPNSSKYENPRKNKSNAVNIHTPQRQSEYESYYEISQCNPIGVTTTSTLFPHNHEMHCQYNIPLGFVFSPLLFLENQNAQVMQRSADKIPRCGHCRAYMNCYNRIEKNNFVCFLCNSVNNYGKEFRSQGEQNDELTSSIYQAIGPTNFYQNEPPEQTFVFLIDINSDAAYTNMLYYAVIAMKQVLSRPQLDDLCIYFYTYDQIIQQYDFAGEDIKCTILDQTIQDKNQTITEPCFLKDIRDKLFNVLDAIQEISQNNHRKGSNFNKCLQYVFNKLKHTGAKFFILQANQAISGQNVFWEQGNNKQIQNNKPTNEINQKSLFESKNKTFFTKYTQETLKYQCTLSFYCFGRNFKNLRVLHDLMKLSNSQLKYYSKDSPADLDKFYYDFSYFLGTNYFKNVVIETLISSGWHFTAIYGNFYRKKQYITFQINATDSSKKMVALVNPSKTNPQMNVNSNPFCAVQTVTNYRYKRQHFICVSTIVQPLTGQIQRLYASIDPANIVISLAKGFLSSLRMESINNARKKFINAISSIYTSALQVYLKPANIPDTIITIITAALGLLKSAHSQPELINNTPTMDKVIGERNFLQFSGSAQLSCYFNPYMFDLTNMTNQMCRQDIQFSYPPTIEAKFANVKDGLFLMDNGLSLYLFIAKSCDPQLLNQVFGQHKFTKNDIISEQMLSNQTNFRASQVQTLIKFLREQKSFGWIPLYIVRCGENTLNQKNLYLNFYQQKYAQFRNYNMTVQEFIALISKPNSF